MRYLITVSQNHVLPALVLLRTLRAKTAQPITIVGNVDSAAQKKLTAFNIDYIDENDINLNDRYSNITWQQKGREAGWYKQQFIRLSIDRFIEEEFVVILDSEVFVFDNWDESKFFHKSWLSIKTHPRYFYWISRTRKPEWDYRMYLGGAYLLKFLPECNDIMHYANSDRYQRHISGVQLFSKSNLAHLWSRLEQETDLTKNLSELLNDENLLFSEYELYGLAVNYGLFNNVVKTIPYNNLLGWYDNHDDRNFHKFKKNAMWSMCQRYQQYKSASEYVDYMEKTAQQLHQHLPTATYLLEDLANISY